MWCLFSRYSILARWTLEDVETKFILTKRTKCVQDFRLTDLHSCIAAAFANKEQLNVVCIVSLRGSNVTNVHSGLTAPPCLGAGQVEQGHHQHFGLYEFSERPAGDSPGSSTHPAREQHKQNNSFKYLFTDQSNIF